MDRSFFCGIKLVILDMDGTLYLGDSVFPFTKGFFEAIRSRGIDYLIFTNNASKNISVYTEKLKRMSLDIPKEKILTSGDVTAEFLRTERRGRSVFLVGTPCLFDVFSEYGIRTVAEDPDIVVVSFDTTLTYDKLEKACRYIRGGAEFISTHCDLNCPTEDGFVPDSGSICAAVTASTGRIPRYFGKPYPETVYMIEKLTGHKRSEMAMIGDRLYTDMKMGVQSGMKTILVLSGETGIEDAASSPVKPDHIVKDIGALIGYIRI